MKVALFVFDEMTALDAIGPYDVLSRVPGVELSVVGLERGLIRTELGRLGVSADLGVDEVPAADVLVVPGGFGTRALVDDKRVRRWLAAIDRTTRITASVCTGALLLGAAGLLRGRRANTHWGVRDRLREFGAIPVAERLVRDGKYATSAGVSAGIDLGIALAHELAGKAAAEAIVLSLEYDPAPPIRFEEVSAEVREAVSAAIAAREAQVKVG